MHFSVIGNLGVTVSYNCSRNEVQCVQPYLWLVGFWGKHKNYSCNMGELLNKLE